MHACRSWPIVNMPFSLYWSWPWSNPFGFRLRDETSMIKSQILRFSMLLNQRGLPHDYLDSAQSEFLFDYAIVLWQPPCCAIIGHCLWSISDSSCQTVSLQLHLQKCTRSLFEKFSDPSRCLWNTVLPPPLFMSHQTEKGFPHPGSMVYTPDHLQPRT